MSISSCRLEDVKSEGVTFAEEGLCHSLGASLSLAGDLCDILVDSILIRCRSPAPSSREWTKLRDKYYLGLSFTQLTDYQMNSRGASGTAVVFVGVGRTRSVKSVML
jgi:hypothetical protein